MIFNNLFGVFALSIGFIDEALTLSTKLLHNRYSNGVEGPGLIPRQDATATCLAAKSIATASFLDGQGKGTNGVAPGQSPSETDKVNFIHVCDGKTLTNGLQNKVGSCNPIPMGDIPSFDNMVTTIITSPGQGEDLEANKDFDIKLQVNNLNAGSFTNPQVTYYAAPQRLKNGKIIGHVHVTIQDLKGSLTPNTPPDPTSFVHFKGIDDDGDGKGGLTNTVTGGLPPGFYRICTLSSASNHQPVIMPVAQRGAQDDCIRITIGQGTGANNAGGNNKGGNSGGNNQGGNNQGGNNQGGNNQGGNNQGGNNQGGNSQSGNNQGGNSQGGNAQGGNAQGGSNQGGSNQGDNNGANSDEGNGGNTAGKSDGVNASGNSNGGDNKNGAAPIGNNNAGNSDGKNDGGKPDGKNGGSKSDGKANGNDNSNSNGSSNGSNDGSNNVTKSADDKKAATPTDGAKSADGNSVIKSDGNKDIAGESKKAAKSHNKAAPTSTPGAAQSSNVPSGKRKGKRFEGDNSHQEQRRGPRPQTRQTHQSISYMMI